VLLQVGNGYQLCVIDLFDAEGRYLPLLMGNVFLPFSASSLVTISTPIGVYKGYPTTHIMFIDIIEDFYNNILDRFSLVNTDVLPVIFNRIYLYTLSRRFNVNIYTGVNAYNSNMNFGLDVLQWGPSNLIACGLPELNSAEGITVATLPLIITPLL